MENAGEVLSLAENDARGAGFGQKQRQVCWISPELIPGILGLVGGDPRGAGFGQN